MLELYNTLSRKQEAFEPLNRGRVKMFTCGASIYRRPHIGNYRSFIWEDVLQRYLEYLGYSVERAMNFTDVEDKAIAEAESAGVALPELTERIAQQFHREAELLRIKLPSHILRSSTTVEQAVRLIRILLDKGYAYWHDHDVFFDPLKFNGFGKLFGLDMSRWPTEKRRFRRDTYRGRRWNLGDFILWHGYKGDGDVYWETAIGRGRPAWNIQDPAIISQSLGYVIDIACGGIDNLYRHHDYNIAVMEAVSDQQFARYWLHGEHLLADGKKMSKSKGNIIYPEHLQEEGLTPQQIRFYLMYGHHRRELNLTRKHLRETGQRLEALKNVVQQLIQSDSSVTRSDAAVSGMMQGLKQGFESAMNQDLHVKGAVDALFAGLSQLLEVKRRGKLAARDVREIDSALRKMDQVLQVIFD